MTNRAILPLCAALCASGCYASHGATTARVDGLTVEHAWMEGDVGLLREVSGEAYELDVIDRRAEGQPWIDLHVHTGARGGDAHPWAMIGVGLHRMSLSESDLPAGAELRFFEEDPAAPAIALWACSGPGHGIQEFEASATLVDVRVLEGGAPGEREVVLEAELEGGQRVRGGFTLHR